MEKLNEIAFEKMELQNLISTYERRYWLEYNTHSYC
jgi:hypothetical protein